MLDKEFCVSISNCPNFWPSEPRLINRITADYGRSHYIFIEGSPSIPEAIHKYVYHCEGRISDLCESISLSSLIIEGEVNLEERKNFFTKFNLWNEKIPAFCGDFTAERGYVNSLNLLFSYHDLFEISLINIFRRILTRVKYELLIGYLQQHATHLSLEECRLVDPFFFLKHF